VNDILTLERSTVNISDDEKVFLRVETEIGQSEIVRFQYDNHLGSACLELDESGLIISFEEYHPFGTTSYRAGRSATEVSQKRYKYCGKERDEETGLYYYGMRYYAGWICRFVSVDPLQFKYPYYTPYQYAGNKPITFIDLDGLEGVKPHGYEELKMIQNTLTPEQAQYVQFDKDGYIDKELISSFTGEVGENFLDLIDMVNYNGIIDIELVEDGCSYSDDPFGFLQHNSPFLDWEKYGMAPPAPSQNSVSTGEAGCLGVTLLPTKEANNPSPDDNIKVYINNKLSPEGRAEIFAHEGYGHANFFVNTNDYKSSVHDYPETEDVAIDLNFSLDQRIKSAMLETRQNMKKR
jgi:RHS repeat-associated protein